MVTKLAETMNKTTIIIHKLFIFFSKNCVSSLSVASTSLEGISALLGFFSSIFFARVKKNKRLKAPRARTIENRAKMLKVDWFKNDIAHVLIKMVSPLGKAWISFFSSYYHSVYNCISYNKK